MHFQISQVTHTFVSCLLFWVVSVCISFSICTSCYCLHMTTVFFQTALIVELSLEKRRPVTLLGADMGQQELVLLGQLGWEARVFPKYPCCCFRLCASCWSLTLFFREHPSLETTMFVKIASSLGLRSGKQARDLLNLGCDCLCHLWKTVQETSCLLENLVQNNFSSFFVFFVVYFSRTDEGYAVFLVLRLF